MHMLMILLGILEFIFVGGILVIGADLAYHEYKVATKHRPVDLVVAGVITEKQRTIAQQNMRRNQQEEMAYEGFFEESYVPGFLPDGRPITRTIKIPTKQAWEYYQLMDKLASTVRLDKTEVITNGV